jgi:hypothetical protein
VSASKWSHDILEPRATGREAFWRGRSIGANPLVGDAAREWRDGWCQGLVDFAARTGQSALPSSARERQRLLNSHRPEDIPVASVAEPVMSHR